MAQLTVAIVRFLKFAIAIFIFSGLVHTFSPFESPFSSLLLHPTRTDCELMFSALPYYIIFPISYHLVCSKKTPSYLLIPGYLILPVRHMVYEDGE